MIKSILLPMLLAVLSFSAHSSEMPTRDVFVGVNDVFVPGGFNSSSDVYVIVSGMFPNSCYSWKQAHVMRDEKAKNVTNIQSVAAVNQGMCLMVLVPFQKQVQIGQMDRGTHTLRFMSGDGTYLEKTIEIQ